MKISVALFFFLIAGAAFAEAPVASDKTLEINTPHPVSNKTLDMTSYKAVIDALGARNYAPGSKIGLDIPAIFYSNKNVPVRIKSEYPGVDLVVFVIDRAPRPLVFSIAMKPVSDLDLVFSLDIQKTSNVRAMLRSEGKWYGVEKMVRLATETWK